MTNRGEPSATASAPAPTAVAAAAAVETAPRGCTNLKLRQLTRRVTQHYDRVVAAEGLKNTQYALLSHVLAFGPIRPSDLAARMRVDASTLTRNLQPLVAQGWVEIGAGADARSRLVRITPSGEEKRRAGQQAWKRAQLALNTRLGEATVSRLHALLDECLGLLGSAAPSPVAATAEREAAGEPDRKPEAERTCASDAPDALDPGAGRQKA